MPVLDSQTNSGYEFRPLNKDKHGAKRLVRIDSQLEDSSICCMLKHFPDENGEVPEYDAISYVWGNPNATKLIYIKDCGETGNSDSKLYYQLIYQNLWEFLDYIYKSNKSNETKS